jgi:L-asparagine oxygenase
MLTRFQAILAEAVGEMVAYESQREGSLVHELVPDRRESHLQTSLGSAVELEAHTEQCFSALRPDFLSLACHQSSSEALTYIWSVDDISDALDPVDIKNLMSKAWETGVDTSFRASLPQKTRGPFSIPHSGLYRIYGVRTVLAGYQFHFRLVRY